MGSYISWGGGGGGTSELYTGVGAPTVAPTDPTKNAVWIDTAYNPEKVTHWWNTATNAWELLSPNATYKTSTLSGIVAYCGTVIPPADVEGSVVQFPDGSTWILKTGGDPAVFFDWLKIEQQGGVYRRAVFDSIALNLADYVILNPTDAPGAAFRFADGSIWELRANGDPLVIADWLPVNADFWRSGALGVDRPDNTTDITDNIAHDGNVTIGNSDPSFTTPTGASATNSHLILSETDTDKGQLMKNNAPLIYSMTRTIPTTLNGVVGICQLSGVSSASHAFRMSIVVDDVNFATSKIYEFAGKWNNNSTAKILKPTIDAGAYGANNFEILISVANHILTLTLRRTGGTTAGVARIKLEAGVAFDETIIENSNTATDPTVYATLDFSEQEVIQGATSPVLNSTAPTGAKYFYNSTLHKTTRAVEGGLYVAITSDENIVDFSVNADPNTALTTFVPDLQNNDDVIYHSTIDDSTWKWDVPTLTYVLFQGKSDHYFTNATNITAYPTDTVITHNLNSQQVSVDVRDASGDTVDLSVIAYTATTTTLRSPIAFSAPRIFISKK